MAVVSARLYIRDIVQFTIRHQRCHLMHVPSQPVSPHDHVVPRTIFFESNGVKFTFISQSRTCVTLNRALKSLIGPKRVPLAVVSVGLWMGTLGIQLIRYCAPILC